MLLVDNCTAHVTPSDVTNIIVENFAPNLTAHVQPADAGIIRCFKAHYRAATAQRAIDHYDSGITPAHIYDINQLEAMQLAKIAWDEVSQETIHNCWKKAGILPSSLLANSTAADQRDAAAATAASVAMAEAQVADSLNHLQQRGVLQAANRVSMEEFISPQEEDEELAEGDTDEEIARAVMAARKAREMLEINGGDVEEDDTGIEEVPRPTHTQALIAANTLRRYLQELHAPYARKLDTFLTSFGRETRCEQEAALTNTLITDYFT